MGLNALRLRGGMGATQAPHIRRPSTNVRKSCAERTMGVALPLPGCGGGISPHIKAFLRRFLKSSPQVLCPQGHHLGCNIPCCRGRGASSPTNQIPHMKAFLRYFLKSSPQGLMPVRAQFGIKRSAFTRGYGGDASPHIRTASSAKPRSLYAQKGIIWNATSYVAGGRGASGPTKTYVHCRIGNRAYKKRRSREARPDSVVLDL